MLFLILLLKDALEDALLEAFGIFFPKISFEMEVSNFTFHVFFFLFRKY